MIKLELPEDEARAVVDWLAQRPDPDADTALSRAETTIDTALLELEQSRSLTLDPASTQTYQQAIRDAADLIDDGENQEYTRGQAELIADLWGKPGVFAADRVEEVLSDIIKVQVGRIK